MAKRALLIGINRYQIAGADLRGCVNDVEDLSQVLVAFQGFKPSDITKLIDGAATKKAIQSGIKTLLRGLKKGDVALLHYSGHGSNVPDDNKRRGRRPRRDPLSDRSRLGRPAQRRLAARNDSTALPAGASLTVIMDCCHSGTNTRAILPPDAPVKERYLPSPWGLAEVESGRSLPKRVTTELRRSSRAKRKSSDVVDANLPEILITGCRDTQTSADAFINGRYNGALTFALVEAIRATKGRLTYRDLHDRAAGVLKKRKFDQIPQLEGRKARFDTPWLSE